MQGRIDLDGHGMNIITIQPRVSATPIPAPVFLLGTGLIGIAWFRRKCSIFSRQYGKVW